MDDFVPQPTLNDAGGAGGAAPRRLRGRYELGEKIGQGGMGQVWRAIDRTFNDREVALKMLPRELSSDPSAMRQLKSEAEALLALTHPNIVRLHTFEQDDDGLCFLVMEYVRGESLDKIIAREGPLSVARAGKWLSQVAKAIDFAHAPPRKLLHRDIKPGNILIDEHGDAKLADFGLAQTIREITTRVTGKTSSGTPAYMSPQQMFGQDHPSNDVYSFAATMYHVFAGRPPFFKGDLVAQVRFAAPAPIEGLSARVQAAMMKGLSKEVAERPESAGGLVRMTRDGGGAPGARGSGERVERLASAGGPTPIPSEDFRMFDNPKDADNGVDRASPRRFEHDGLLDLTAHANTEGLSAKPARDRPRTQPVSRMSAKPPARPKGSTRVRSAVDWLRGHGFFRRRSASQWLMMFAFVDAGLMVMALVHSWLAGQMVEWADGLYAAAFWVAQVSLAAPLLRGRTEWDGRERVSAYGTGFGAALVFAALCGAVHLSASSRGSPSWIIAGLVAFFPLWIGVGATVRNVSPAGGVRIVLGALSACTAFALLACLFGGPAAARTVVSEPSWGWGRASDAADGVYARNLAAGSAASILLVWWLVSTLGPTGKSRVSSVDPAS